MWTESDGDMAVPIVDQYPAQFPNLASISFDRGYWSVPNFEALHSREIQVILPKKGYKNKGEHERESADEFRQKRRRHAQVESCINGLEQHGGGPHSDQRGQGRICTQHRRKCGGHEPLPDWAGVDGPTTGRLPPSRVIRPGYRHNRELTPPLEVGKVRRDGGRFAPKWWAMRGICLAPKIGESIGATGPALRPRKRLEQEKWHS
ncbi:MAG: hypothetical protein F4X61_07320 [Rhodothermaceae bacterium]|nr:hypothetical protein [Rhodothermaceae bacterium]MYC04425.1 hypothetical protein [Rhodothermaceae bacterium]